MIVSFCIQNLSSRYPNLLNLSLDISAKIIIKNVVAQPSAFVVIEEHSFFTLLRKILEAVESRQK